MDLTKAVHILNEHAHRGHSAWKASEGADPPFAFTGEPYAVLSEFEALAVAEKLAAPEEADRVMDDESDTFLRGVFREAADRRGLARAAMNIPEDRYSAGSTAARFAVAVLLKHGLETARGFIADLAHHER